VNEAQSVCALLSLLPPPLLAHSAHTTPNSPGLGIGQAGHHHQRGQGEAGLWVGGWVCEKRDNDAPVGAACVSHENASAARPRVGFGGGSCLATE